MYEPSEGQLSRRATIVIRFFPPKHASTEIITTAVELPPPYFFAVIWYVVAAISVLAVPDILPVFGSIEMPVGSAGDTLKS